MDLQQEPAAKRGQRGVGAICRGRLVTPLFLSARTMPTSKHRVCQRHTIVRCVVSLDLHHTLAHATTRTYLAGRASWHFFNLATLERRCRANVDPTMSFKGVLDALR